MRYKNQYIFLAFLSFSTFYVKAQNLDSLLQELNSYKKEDTVRLKLLNAISKEYQYSNPKKGLEISDSALVLAQKFNHERETAYAYMIKAENYNQLGGFDNQALECLQKALASFQQLATKVDIAACLNNFGNIYRNLSNYPKALDYYQEALSINRQLDNKRSMGINMGNLGKVYIRLSEFTKSVDYFLKALELSEQAGDKISMAGHLGGIGQAYRFLGDFPKSMEYHQKSLKISEQLNNKPGIASALAELGNVYHLLSNSALGLEYLQKALSINEALHNKLGIAINNQNMGVIYRRKKDYETALKHYHVALSMAEELNNESLAGTCLMNIGAINYLSEDFIKALEYYKRSLAIADKIQNKENILMNINNIAQVYGDAPDSVLTGEGIDPANRYISAIEYFNKALKIAEEIATLPWQRELWKNLSLTYEMQKDYPQAFTTYKKFIQVRDSILNNEKDKKVARLSIQYEFDKKEDSIQFQVQITNEKLKQQQLFAIQQEQKLELGEKELSLSNQEKDLQKLAYLKTQADLQNEQLLKQEKEKQLTIAEKEKQLQSVQVTTLSQENDLSKLRRRQQWLYSIAVFVLLALLVSYFFYNNRLKQGKLKMELAKEKAEQEKKEAEFQRNLADVSLTALRSQMNPHFIFNCLNSIKLYTTQNDTAAASEYLTKFSRLIRLVMENSRNDRISLTAELEALRLYIEMEAMRFKEKLSYSISVDKDVEMDYIEIPPLLLQPYVENAVWHGLMHKEEGGRIDISAGMKKNESLLEINIADNGVGRAKSDELKSKTATRHKSYGMKVTSERIALINQIYKTGASVAIHDITNDKGEVAGTRVVIQIPV